MRIAIALLVVAGVAAVPASAGIEFASTFNDPGLSSAGTLIGEIPGGSVDPAGLVTVTAGSGLGPFSAKLDYGFDPNVDFNSDSLSNDIIIWFGSISGSTLLTSIGVSEDGGTTFTTESFAYFIDASFSGTQYGVKFSTGPGGVPHLNRDHVDVVRLSFTVSPGSYFEIDGGSTPEPGTFALFGLGLFGLGGAVLRRRRRAKA